MPRLNPFCVVVIATMASITGVYPQTVVPPSAGDSEGYDLVPTQTWDSHEWVIPGFQDLSVHDPSVVLADDVFYVFGSHLSAAKTDDLLRWERVADLVSPVNPLFNNVFVELAETFSWAQTRTLWAADVIQLEDGKFYFYYNACRGDSPRSALGVAVSDSIEGPYLDQGIFLKSGQWGEISEDGTTVYDAVVHPNVVDPDTFFDQEGRLWMVYGSYSGGIFILKMDPKSGKPLEGQGYGTILMGGNHQRIEAPNVLYSPHTGYYYLFVTFGGLDAIGGYNMRVARSKTPDGPYYDSKGNDMRDVIAATAFNDAAIEPYAVKLMGNYLFTPTHNQLGYVSPGHSTSYHRAETGQYFLIFHTRFPYQGEFHQLRVHEMFFNEDAWPVVAPLRYAPRMDLLTLEQETGELQPKPIKDDSPTGDEGESTDGDDLEEDPLDSDGSELHASLVYYSDPISETHLPGEYEFLSHGRDTSPTIKRSQRLTLHRDGTLSTGSMQGTWQLYEMEVLPEPDPVGQDSELDETAETPDLIVDEGGENPGEAPVALPPVANPLLKNLITLEIPSIGTFKGVVSLQWNPYLEAFTVTFTALSDDGVSVWGARWADLTETEKP